MPLGHFVTELAGANPTRAHLRSRCARFKIGQAHQDSGHAARSLRDRASKRRILPGPPPLGEPRVASLGRAQPLIFHRGRPQVAEGRCGCRGSNKIVAIERDSFREEQLLELLALVE